MQPTTNAKDKADEATELPDQHHETQVVSESPMTLISDPVAHANIRVQSRAEIPLNQLDEVNESAMNATVSNEGSARQGPMNEARELAGDAILVDTGSRKSAEAMSAAGAEMPDNQHTKEEQALFEVEKLNDEAKFQEVFRKTFITENKKGPTETGDLWSLHDMQIPLGQPAKLIRIADPNNQDFRVSEIADRLKFVQPTPVVLVAGAMSTRPGKTMAGVARAAFNTGSVIIDSGMASNVEKFAMRKGIKLLGVCPEAEVCFPKISNK